MKPKLLSPSSSLEDIVSRFPSTTRWQTLVHVLAIVFAMAASCFATEYQIDSQKTFDELKKSRFKPGDVIQFKRGKRFKGMFAPRGSGTEDAPIILTAYGKGKRKSGRAAIEECAVVGGQ